MKLLTIQPQGSGVGYYRFEVPLSALANVEVRSITPALIGNYGEEFEKNVLQVMADFKPDVIHAGYVTDQLIVGMLLGLREYVKAPLITEIDDDILHVPAYNTAYSSYHGGAQGKKVARMQLRVSDAVSVSTSPLATALNNDCRATAVLPNCLNPIDWDGLQTSPLSSDFTRILFSGNMGRYGDLLVVQEAIEQIMNSRKDVQVLFLGCAPDWAVQWMTDEANPHNNRSFVIRPCSMEYYRPILTWLAPDILIAPVETNDFNKSKSHIKAYDAAMTGAAFICTDWPTYEEVPNSASIKISNTTTQWRDSLLALIDDAALRFRLNSRLKEWALDSWTIDKHIHKWVDLYEEAASKGPLTSIDQIVRPA